MLNREEWLTLARKLDWDYSYVREDEVFPEASCVRVRRARVESKEYPS
jgi:hypothetical protein